MRSRARSCSLIRASSASAVGRWSRTLALRIVAYRSGALADLTGLVNITKAAKSGDGVAIAESASQLKTLTALGGLVDVEIADPRRRQGERALERHRVWREGRLQIRQRDASVDVVHARWAYFFGPGCEPGLAELDRVVRRGGSAFVIDNDATRSTFGAWFRRGYPTVDPQEVELYWTRRGWTRIPVDMGWRFESRADLEAVVRIEFTPEVAAEVLASHTGTEVDYAVNVWWRSW